MVRDLGYAEPGFDLTSDEDLEEGDNPWDSSDGYLHIKVVESVYWDVVFTCAKHTDNFPKMTSCFFLGVSITIQLLLSTVLLRELASNGVAEKLTVHGGQLGNLSNFALWRQDETDGYAQSGDHDWAYYACSGADWSWQQESIANYEAYSKQVFGMSAGRFFANVSISLFLAFIVREFKDIATYLQLITLPTFPAGIECIPRSNPTLCGLPVWVKIMVAFVALARFIICSFVGFYGVQFLSYTEALKDFVLNSIALAFILDIDELVFSVFVERHKKRFLGCIAEVPVQPWELVVFIQDRFSGVIGFFCTAMLMIWVYVFYLDSFAVELHYSAFCALCANTTYNNSVLCANADHPLSTLPDQDTWANQ